MNTPSANDIRWRAGVTTLVRALPRTSLNAGAVAVLREAAAGKETKVLPENSGANTTGTSYPVAVACSGGADSLAALLLVWGHFTALHGRIAVLHFNHRTRSECAAEARFVQGVAEALGEKFFTAELEGDSASLNEAGLREARLQFFQNTCAALGVRALVQGHHAGDVVESVLMRLSRGSGTTGLCAPRPVQQFAGNETAFVRPLLMLEKKQITAALRAAGLPWCEDASNAGDFHLRNRIRHSVVPAWEGATGAHVTPGVLRSRRLIEEDDAALETWAEALWAQVRSAEDTPNVGSASTFDWVPLAKLPAAVHRRVLHKALAALGISENVTAPAVDAVVAALAAGISGQWSAGSSTLLVFTGSQLRLVRHLAKHPPAVSFSGLLAPGVLLFWPTGGVLNATITEVSPGLFAQIRAGLFPPAETVFLALPDNAGMGHYILRPRSYRPGDAYCPLGSPGHRKLSDAFIDKKIPKMERHRLPVVCDTCDSIVWVPGLPPAENCRLPGPGPCLRLTW